jgi:hypothetical protein
MALLDTLFPQRRRLLVLKGQITLELWYENEVWNLSI